jgi:hypothetical protein
MPTVQTKDEPVAIKFDVDVEEEEQYYVTRPHTTIRRYDRPPQHDALEDPATRTGTKIPRRSSAVSQAAPVTGSGILSRAVVPPPAKPAKAPPFRGARSIGRIKSIGRHIRGVPLVAGLLGMVVAVTLILSFSAISNWWQIHQNDMTYGRPRTFQINAVVGHNDSPANPSHFIFINLNRHVVIIELPGGDASHARIYSGPTLFGNGEDLTPVTAEFKDVNGDGKPDMIVMIQDQRLVYINDGTEFRPQKPGEQVNLPQS